MTLVGPTSSLATAANTPDPYQRLAAMRSKCSLIEDASASAPSVIWASITKVPERHLIRPASSTVKPSRPRSLRRVSRWLASIDHSRICSKDSEHLTHVRAVRPIEIRRAPVEESAALARTVPISYIVARRDEAFVGGDRFDHPQGPVVRTGLAKRVASPQVNHRSRISGHRTQRYLDLGQANRAASVSTTHRETQQFGVRGRETRSHR